jgi:hypothetical protein
LMELMPVLSACEWPELNRVQSIENVGLRQGRQAASFGRSDERLPPVLGL